MVKKIGFYRENYFFQVKLDGQHCDASESIANFWGYVGNKKHTKLSAWTYGFSRAFYMAHLLE